MVTPVGSSTARSAERSFRCTRFDCAECGCELAFGESYTSRLIHNDLGFGYAVCPRCYEAEFREMGESCDL